MKLLVTGANGFTGHHFVESAKQQGFEVIALGSDLRNKEQIDLEVKHAQPDYVVHLAAISFVGHANSSDFYDINVIGTMNLLESLASLQIKPKKILLASSANIYGNCDASPITEEQTPAPVNHYAMSKLAMEYMAKTYLNRLPIFFSRPFNYTGIGQSIDFLIPKLVKHFADKALKIELGNIDVEREFNDITFVCQVYLKLLQNANSGETYNICTGKAISLKEVISTLTSLTGHQLHIDVNPKFVRANEVHRLCGSPDKLIRCIGSLPAIPLSETLTSMLKKSD